MTATAHRSRRAAIETRCWREPGARPTLVLMTPALESMNSRRPDAESTDHLGLVDAIAVEADGPRSSGEALLDDAQRDQPAGRTEGAEKHQLRRPPGNVRPGGAARLHDRPHVRTAKIRTR